LTVSGVGRIISIKEKTRRNPQNMPKSGRENFRKIAELSSLGLTLPSSIIVGLFFGYILDKTFHTTPWLLLSFLGLGIVSGFYSLFKGLKKYSVTASEENGTPSGKPASRTGGIPRGDKS
jgi:ATP synthase protein I